MSCLKYFLIGWPGEVYLGYVENLLNNFGIVSGRPGEWLQNVSLGCKTPGNVTPVFRKGKKKSGNYMSVSVLLISGKILQ